MIQVDRPEPTTHGFFYRLAKVVLYVLGGLVLAFVGLMWLFSPMMAATTGLSEEAVMSIFVIWGIGLLLITGAAVGTALRFKRLRLAFPLTVIGWFTSALVVFAFYAAASP